MKHVSRALFCFTILLTVNPLVANRIARSKDGEKVFYLILSKHLNLANPNPILSRHDSNLRTVNKVCFNYDDKEFHRNTRDNLRPYGDQFGELKFEEPSNSESGRGQYEDRNQIGGIFEQPYYAGVKATSKEEYVATNIRQYRRTLVSSMRKYLAYLGHERKSLDVTDLEQILLGLTVAQAQLEATPWTNSQLQFLKLHLYAIQTAFLQTLINKDTENSSFWGHIFDPQLWTVLNQPLRMVRDENGHKSEEFSGNVDEEHRFDMSKNEAGISMPPDSPEYKTVKNSAFEKSGAKSWPRNYFQETKLRQKSNQCLQGLLESCSMNEECGYLMMEQAGGYSLAHQTLYFILAKQRNCTLRDSAGRIIPTQHQIQSRCSRMADENDVIQSLGTLEKTNDIGGSNSDDDADVNYVTEEEMVEGRPIRNAEPHGEKSKGMDSLRNYIRQVLAHRTLNELGNRMNKRDGNKQNINVNGRVPNDINNIIVRLINVNGKHNKGRNLNDRFGRSGNIDHNGNIDDNGNIYDTKNLNDRFSRSETGNRERNTNDMNGKDLNNIDVDYLDLYVENCVVCGMENYMEFLSTALSERIMEYQTEQGCFARYGDACEHHLSAVSIAFLSMQLRLFSHF